MRDELRATLHELEIEHGHSSDHEAVWPVCARRHAVMDRARAALLADTPSVEPRWAEWARYIAPLVNDGLIDTPNERNVPDKAFVIAHLLDDVLPLRPSVEPAGLARQCSFMRGLDGYTNCTTHGWTGYRDDVRRVAVCPALLPTQANDSPDPDPTTSEPPTGYWCCAGDWNAGTFRTGDCIGRTQGPDPQWARLVVRP